MMTLYRRKACRAADEVQERLEELVLAHRVVEVDGDRPDEVSPDRPLPVLVESGEAYSGGEIAAVLDEIQTELTYERQVSADACFIDPESAGHCV